MASLVNSFSYSPSQWGQFETCHRQYWFSRYGSWGGWEKNCHPLTREIYRLKKLSNRYLWSGSRVHEAISGILKSFQAGNPIDPELEKQKLLQRMRQDFRDSKSLPPGEIPPKGSYRFVEHDDQEMAIIDSAWKEIVEKSVVALENFFLSEPWEWIRSLGPDCLLRTDEILESIPFQTDGVDFPVYLSIDLAINDPEGLIILDWKTGKPSPKSHQPQLDLYAYYAVKKLDCPPDKVRTGAIYISSPERKVTLEYSSGKIMEETHARIETHTRTILSKIQDPFNGIANKDEFAPTPGAYSCKSGFFRRVCENSY